MKARVIATGEIVEVYESCSEDFPWTDEMGDKVWKTEELIFLETTDNTPDYWIRLEHTYAGMAMQSYISNNVYLREIREMCKEPQEMRDLIADLSILLAATLVQKLKEKEERK